MAIFKTTLRRCSPIYLLAIFIISLSFLTRLILLISFSTSIHAGAGQLITSFFIGLLYDLMSTAFILLPLTLLITCTNEFIYSKNGKWWAILLSAGMLFILFFTNIIPADFNRSLYKVFKIYVIGRIALYFILLSAGFSWRNRWRIIMVNFVLIVTVFCLLFNAVSEWFFWDEFSSRYNFIAVDYLVYTNEVLGNIRESYPIGWLIAAIAIVTVVIMRFFQQPIRHAVYAPARFSHRMMIAGPVLLLLLVAVFLVPPGWKNFSSNNYANELAGNGPYEFVQAFKNNELDFYRYYSTISDEQAFQLVRAQLKEPNTSFTSVDSFSIERDIHATLPENKMNVVMISVESLSASFMSSFGNTRRLTPNLDSLAQKGMLFTNLYASGTRTVRGLEALALSIPPTPGQSLVKRPNNEGLFSLGHVFRTKGYSTHFIYGGYGYFDNMNYFFSHNEYEVIDRSALAPSEIHYANIWGVADEDLFTLALRHLDSSSSSGKPFFAQVMTVSNHKPYTYPEGRIEIPATAHSRDGAVKYTDFAIGDFIKRASKKSWFNNTLFVIVADHCASSAGNTALPVTGYHIPLIIYSPGNIQPQLVPSLTAQIDIGPTILGLLHFNYRSRFFGKDIFNTATANQRAFISTYQGLGFIQQQQLILQSPVKQVKTYLPDFVTGMNKVASPDSTLIKAAIAQYQVAAWLIKHKKYNAD